MSNQVYTFNLSISWKLIQLISQIDRFDASWSVIEKKERKTLNHLGSIATIRSVGASTRIEGSKMSDQEVRLFLEEINISKIVDRDAQEVLGYYEVIDLINESHKNIDISENSLKNLHNILLKHSQKDSWHKGNYKQHSNAVEAILSGGKKYIIFQTTEAGIPTEDAMRQLIDWYLSDNEIHPLVRTALFVYDFVSIHPFQDGNGRLSRLLSILLLLKHNYKWIKYVSFEHEIENRKIEYYRVLRNCQSQRPNEDVTEWVLFFLDALGNIQQQLMTKLEQQGIQARLSPREKSILGFIGSYPGCKSGEIARKLDIPSPSVKRILSKLVKNNLIEKFGSGPGTNYSI